MRRDEKPDPLVRQRFASVWPSPDDPPPVSEHAVGSPASAWRDPPRTPYGRPSRRLADRAGEGARGSAYPPAEPDERFRAPDPVGIGGPARASAPAVPAVPATPAVPAASSALAALNPGRRAVKALAAVAVVVFVIAAFLAWRSQPRAEAVAPPSPRPPAKSAAVLPVPAPAPASAPATTIVVAVTGRVRRPGLVTLPAGARVADAIAAAGGVLPHTDLSFVNLARKVVDGELIVIGIQPSPGQAADPTGGDSPAAGGAAAGPVDINTAGLTQLETLPGIGPALAQRIVDYRAQHGAFRSIDDLQNVSGIGPSKYAEIKDFITT